jgi:hypothetical protein
MARNAAITATVGIALFVVIVATTFSLMPSLSVGGSVYSGDPETCASCHNEVPYVQGYRGSPHDEGNVTCMDCHQYRSPITDVQCLTCHEDYKESNKTQFTWLWVVEFRTIDAHANAHIPAKCTTCHLEHRFELGMPHAVTQSLCRDCHQPYNP